MIIFGHHWDIGIWLWFLWWVLPLLPQWNMNFKRPFRWYAFFFSYFVRQASLFYSPTCPSTNSRRTCWPQTHRDLPASATQGLELKAHTITVQQILCLYLKRKIICLQYKRITICIRHCHWQMHNFICQ